MKLERFILPGLEVGYGDPRAPMAGVADPDSRSAWTRKADSKYMSSWKKTSYVNMQQFMDLAIQEQEHEKKLKRLLASRT